MSEALARRHRLTGLPLCLGRQRWPEDPSAHPPTFPRCSARESRDPGTCAERVRAVVSLLGVAATQRDVSWVSLRYHYIVCTVMIQTIVELHRVCERNWHLDACGCGWSGVGSGLNELDGPRTSHDTPSSPSRTHLCSSCFQGTVGRLSTRVQKRRSDLFLRIYDHCAASAPIGILVRVAGQSMSVSSRCPDQGVSDSPARM